MRPFVKAMLCSNGLPQPSTPPPGHNHRRETTPSEYYWLNNGSRSPMSFWLKTNVLFAATAVVVRTDNIHRPGGGKLVISIIFLIFRQLFVTPHRVWTRTLLLFVKDASSMWLLWIWYFRWIYFRFGLVDASMDKMIANGRDRGG